MAKSVPALINSEMLVWARESARLSVEEAAHKIGIAVDKLEACETDDAQLTFNQLMKAASVYKRPVSLFYLKKRPTGWAPIQDFRRLADAEAGFSPASPTSFVRPASAGNSRLICMPTSMSRSSHSRSRPSSGAMWNPSGRKSAPISA